MKVLYNILTTYVFFVWFAAAALSNSKRINKDVKTEFIGNSDYVLESYFGNDEKKYLNKKDMSDLLCQFLTGRDTNNQEKLMEAYKRVQKKQRPNWVEHEAIQYLMVNKYIVKSYSDDFYDKQAVNSVLQNQDFVSNHDVLNFVTNEIDEINKNQNLIMERPSREELKNEL